jgi:hypothetical protein
VPRIVVTPSISASTGPPVSRHGKARIVVVRLPVADDAHVAQHGSGRHRTLDRQRRDADEILAQDHDSNVEVTLRRLILRMGVDFLGHMQLRLHAGLTRIDRAA